LNEVVYSQIADDEEFPPKPVSEQLNASDRAKHKDTQKDRLARAKRIIRSITPDLLQAASREAELGLKSVDEERHNVSTILDNALHPSADSGHVHTDGEGHDGSSEAGVEHQVLRQIDVNGQNQHEEGHKKPINESADEDAEMAGTDDETVQKEGGNENAAHLVNGLSNGDTDAGASNRADSQEGDGDHTSSAQITPGLNVPALSNSGSTNHSTSAHEPLTPPEGEKEITALNHGGVPWYLEEFEPQGTTVFEPKDNHSQEDVSNTDALRGISEELSELDDDVVNGLVDGMEKPSVAVSSGNTLVVPTSSPKRKPKSKRKR
jgi:NuA3 HAT complex component NTO1